MNQVGSVLALVTQCATCDIASVVIARDAWSTRAAPGCIALLVQDGLHLDTWIISPTGDTRTHWRAVSQYTPRGTALPVSHPQHAARLAAVVAELRVLLDDATCETILVQAYLGGTRIIGFTVLPSGQRVREERVL